MRRIRRSVKRRLVLFWLCAAGGVLLTGGLFFVAEYQACMRYEGQLREAKEALMRIKRFAYVALRDIAAGEVFSEENLVFREVYSDEAQEHFAGKEILFNKALTDIKEGTRLLPEMGTEAVFEDGTRECVYSDIVLAEHLRSGDVVDIRIQYPNGENYCIVSKKELKRNEEDTYESRFLLSREEQLFLSSALYDKTEYVGTSLYAVRYVAGPLQEQTKADYVPAAAVVEQLSLEKEAGERLLQKRRELEVRLYEKRGK